MAMGVELDEGALRHFSFKTCARIAHANRKPERVVRLVEELESIAHHPLGHVSLGGGRLSH